MSEVKDPKIKLFGKTIGVVETAPQSGGAVSIHFSEPAAEDRSNQEPPCSSDSMFEDGDLNRDVEEKEWRESLSGCKQDYTKDEHQSNPPTSKELKDSSDSRPMTEDPNPPSSETEAESEKVIKNEDDRNESSEKTLKKPDKIIPCPRCNSMDTKFCYFNNYNVNQPRHFCKNCQRYWTAGGTMRNVPIGAGRRKNKNSISQFRHLNVPDALQSGRVDLNGIHHPAFNPNGAVLTFGTDSPLCESMAAVLNIADKTISTGSRNAFQRTEEVEISASDRSKESMNDSSSRSSTTASSSKDEVGKNNCQPFPQQMPCYAGGPPWPYMWNPLQWNSSMPPPAFAPPSFPMSFYSATPPPYWACSVPGPWNAPWVISPTSAPSQSHTPPSSTANSPTLGKHSRDENIQKVGSTEEGGAKERNLWVPKTLRIDDPGEAAKSSIWETLGINKDKVEGVGGGAIFKAFQTRNKCDEKSHASENSTVLQANPAAFSRSVSFHERT